MGEPNLDLPSGYRVEREVDTLVRLRADGTTVAVFSAQGFDPRKVDHEAWADNEKKWPRTRKLWGAP